MNIKYDSNLVDYNSESFYIGHKEGLDSVDGIPKYTRSEDATDVEWASYCEGVLMRWYEKLGD